MRITFMILSLFMGSFIYAQEGNPNYDNDLAQKLGADDYGMKMYVFVILKSGNNVSENKSKRDSCFEGHMKNMRRLTEENKLILAGPMGENDDDIRGLFILNITTIEEAAELLLTDPAINENYLSTELYPWYGSAAISEYLAASDKIWKKKP